MLKRFAIAAAALLATPALAQTTTPTTPSAPPANGDFVMYITAHPDHTLSLSMGFLQLSGTNATIVRRRELAPACQFNPASDLPVSPTDVTPVRPPRGLTPDGVGQFGALTFDVAANAKGATPSAEELGCMRAVFTAMAQQAMRGQQPAQAPTQ